LTALHCAFCGVRFGDEVEGFPRRCRVCERTTYRNPLPVAVAVVPVEGGGFVMVQRALAPVGLAFPGGFIEDGERWQDALARELFEETGVRVDADAVVERRVLSAPDGTLLVFGSVPAVPRSALAAFVPSEEVSGLLVVDGPRDDVVFPLHGQVLREVTATAR
jgi:8-oxo-dGTP pyrophosphatase MutT (NUDIX family)